MVCASTGNTSASAAAYAAKAGLLPIVLLPAGRIATGKLAQAIVHGAKVVQVDGNFDDCLELARELADDYPVALVNSVNPIRIEGQKTAAFEVVDDLGDAPDLHVHAGRQRREHLGLLAWLHPVRGGRQGHPDPAHVGLPGGGGGAAGARSPGARSRDRGHRDPDRQPGLGAPGAGRPRRVARADRGGHRRADPRRPGLPGRREGIFVEPASAAGVAGLLAKHERGEVDSGLQIVVTVTGHGLKDIDTALSGRGPVQAEVVAAELDAVAAVCGLRAERAGR